LYSYPEARAFNFRPSQSCYLFCS